MRNRIFNGKCLCFWGINHNAILKYVTTMIFAYYFKFVAKKLKKLNNCDCNLICCSKFPSD
jgi:hypothetical protein